MKLTKKQIKILRKAQEDLNDLQNLLTDRIVENNRIKKARPDMLVEQCTHTYMLYRYKCWDAEYAIRDVLEQLKEKK